jgi:hypothetical protein
MQLAALERSEARLEAPGATEAIAKRGRTRRWLVARRKRILIIVAVTVVLALGVAVARPWLAPVLPVVTC